MTKAGEDGWDFPVKTALQRKCDPFQWTNGISMIEVTTLAGPSSFNGTGRSRTSSIRPGGKSLLHTGGVRGRAASGPHGISGQRSATPGHAMATHTTPSESRVALQLLAMHPHSRIQAQGRIASLHSAATSHAAPRAPPGPAPTRNAAGDPTRPDPRPGGAAWHRIAVGPVFWTGRDKTSPSEQVGLPGKSNTSFAQ